MNPAQMARRYRTIASLMKNWGRTPTGKLRRGFWIHAANEIERVEGRPLEACYRDEALAQWWRMYNGKQPSPDTQHDAYLAKIDAGGLS